MTTPTDDSMTQRDELDAIEKRLRLTGPPASPAAPRVPNTRGAVAATRGRGASARR
jgi:hypothetical protein